MWLSQRSSVLTDLTRRAAMEQRGDCHCAHSPASVDGAGWVLHRLSFGSDRP